MDKSNHNNNVDEFSPRSINKQRSILKEISAKNRQIRLDAVFAKQLSEDPQVSFSVSYPVPHLRLLPERDTFSVALETSDVVNGETGSEYDELSEDGINSEFESMTETEEEYDDDGDLLSSETSMPSLSSPLQFITVPKGQKKLLDSDPRIRETVDITADSNVIEVAPNYETIVIDDDDDDDDNMDDNENETGNETENEDDYDDEY